jgi:hypothetical protein
MHIEVMRQAVTGLSKDVSGLLSSIFHDTFASSFILIFQAEVNNKPFRDKTMQIQKTILCNCRSSEWDETERLQAICKLHYE